MHSICNQQWQSLCECKTVAPSIIAHGKSSESKSLALYLLHSFHQAFFHAVLEGDAHMCPATEDEGPGPLHSRLMPAIGTVDRGRFICPVTSWVSNFYINDKQNAAEVLTRVLSTLWGKKKILSTFCQTARLAHSSLSPSLSLSFPSSLLYLSIYLFLYLSLHLSLSNFYTCKMTSKVMKSLKKKKKNGLVSAAR